MKNEIYLPILGIAAGEIMMLSGHVYIGLALHVINLQAITLALIFSDLSIENKNLIQILLLLLQMRILNLAMPQFFTTKLLWYPLVYGVMFISIYYVTKQQNITSKDIGINFNRWYLYIPLALLIAAAMAMLEFKILDPVALITNLKIQNILLISIVMFIFVAAIEELIFRSLLQTRLQSVFGANKGVLYGAGLFGIMHSGYGLMDEILFATFFGVVLGFIFQKTRSFPFILIIHGTANVFLFGILPIVSR
ncbi:MAG: CPBP family intramembrane metalloprotease [Candidatus Methanoperedens sp.]|nr:CPBP family intramembrane metalloprotease [Candidatus Methanoperedens sp.]